MPLNSAATFDDLAKFLRPIDDLVSMAGEEGKQYAQPALKNLGSIAIPILREVISPASFRNEEAEMTDIRTAGERRVRAVANKFKFGERSRGLQVLRFFKAGGRQAQNKTAFGPKDKPSSGYDMNTIVFGDSANHGKRVLPVKATAQYSDALSLQPYEAIVDKTFHNRASEDGTLFNAEKKENSTNIFERHFIQPGALLLQVVTFNGRTAPVEALEHFLLSLGLAGAYGGQTSIYGVNVRNHVVGVYAGAFEREIASPYVAIERLCAEEGFDADGVTAAVAQTALDRIFTAAYPLRVGASDVRARQEALIAGVEGDDAALRADYQNAGTKIGAFFDAWFAGFGGAK